MELGRFLSTSAPHPFLPPGTTRVIGVYPIEPSADAHPLALFSSHAVCGFPSPAEDYVETSLSLDELVLRNPAATFMVRVEGRSMQEAGIEPGDLLVVDRSLEARTGHIVVATVCGEQTVKYLRLSGNGTVHLVAAHPDYTPMAITREMDFEVWGVVTFVLKKTA